MKPTILAIGYGSKLNKIVGGLINMSEETKQLVDNNELSDVDTPEVEGATEGAEKKISQEDFIRLAEAEQSYTDSQVFMDQMLKNKELLLSRVSGDRELLERKIGEFSSVAELTASLNTKEAVNEFFRNEDGTPMTIITDNGTSITEEEDFEFKKGLCLYIKQLQMSQDDLTAQMKKFADETQEIRNELGLALRDFIEGQLSEIPELRKKIMSGEKLDSEKKKALKEIDCVESGFTFKMILDTFAEHPTIPVNTLKDMMNDDSVISIGKRYRLELSKSNTHISLVSLISDSPQTSFEAVYLPPDKYTPGKENLFVFSLIRYFAMTYWTPEIRKLHTSIIILMQRFIKDELTAERKEQYVENIATYLKSFE